MLSDPMKTLRGCHQKLMIARMVKTQGHSIELEKFSSRNEQDDTRVPVVDIDMLDRKETVLCCAAPSQPVIHEDGSGISNSISAAG